MKDNRGKLLAAVMAMVMLIVGFAAIASVADSADATTASEVTIPSDLEEIEASSFKNGETVTLTKDSVIKTPFTAADGSYTLNLNGFKLYAEKRVVTTNTGGAVAMDFTIDGTKDGSAIIGKSDLIFANSTGKLTVNGGHYEAKVDGMYAFIWGVAAGGSEAEFTDVDIDAYLGLWLSYGEFESILIDDCIINAEDKGIYLATPGDITNPVATVSDTKIVAGMTAIEMKGGNVLIERCEITSKTYEATDGLIANSGSGHGVATLNINNGYNTAAKADGTFVTVNDCTLINTAKDSKVINITAGTMASWNEDTEDFDIPGDAATGNISFTSNCVTADEIAIVYSEKAKTANISIDIALNGKTSEVITSESPIDTTKAESGDVLIVNSEITGQEDIALKNGTSLVIASGGSYEGNISVDETSIVSVSDGSFKGDVTNGTGTGASITNIDVTGSFTVKYGSISIDGVDYSGTITVTQGTLDIAGIAASASPGTGALVIDAAARTTVVIDRDLTVGAGGLTINNTNASGTVNVVVNADVVVDGTMTLNDGVVLSNSGSILVKGTLVNNEILNNSGTFVIDGTLTNSGTFTNTGSVMNNGTIANNGSFNNNGSMYNATGATFTGTPLTGNPAVDGLGISTNMDAIESDLPLTGYAFLTGDLTIPEGKSITVRSNGVLDLNGHTLTVDGKLVVEMGGTVIGVPGGENIVVIGKGTVENSGVIGSGNVPVTVQTSSDSKTELLNVEGVSFGTTKVGGTAYLTVTGDVITAVNSYTTYVLNMDGVYVTGGMSIASDIVSVIGINGITVMKDAVLEIDGTVGGYGIDMKAGSTVTVTGICTSVITADTGVRETTSKAPLGTTTVSLDGVNGVTLTVVSTSFVKNNDSDVPTSYTEYALYISGNVDYATAVEEGSITIDNTKVDSIEAISRIAADATLVLPDGVTMDAGGTVVLGTIEYVEAQNAVTEFVGAQYTVKDGTKYTYFIKEFTAALAAIDTADKKTINVRGPVEVESDFTLADGQVINIVAGTFKVSDDAKVTVQSGGRITGVVSEVTGILTVERGGNVQSVTKYAVYSEGTDGSRTYAGFVAAIENSNPGDRITVSGVGYLEDELVIDESVSIPGDRTVIITHDIRFKGDLTVEEGATVTNQAEILMMDDEATITVNGVLDSTAAQSDVDFNVKTVDADKDRNIFVTGEYKVNEDADLVFENQSEAYARLNGAYYTDDGVIVVTSFAKAVAAITADADLAKQVAVIGTVNETGEVSVAGSASSMFYVTIKEDADVTLGTVALSYATLTVNGELTATLTGTYGVDGESTASVGLEDVENFVFVNSYAPNELAQNVWITTIGTTDTGNNKTFVGAVTVASGEVELANAAGAEYKDTTEEKNGLTVSSGAVLVVPKGITLTVGENTEIAGTVAVEGTLETAAGTNNDVKVTIAGTIDVQKDDKISGTFEVPAKSVLILTGTLNVAEGATATVTGKLQLGETPKMLGSGVSATGEVVGKIALAGAVKAYNGSSIEDAEFVNDSDVAFKGTTYVINGLAYATVFDADTSAVVSDIDEEIASLRDLDVEYVEKLPVITWYAGDVDASDAKIGTYAEVSTEIRYAGVPVTVSVGSHISLSIDGVILHSTTGYVLTIGTHQVSAVVDAGYSGSVTITFNGQPVTNGQITITSDMLTSVDQIVLSASSNITQDSTIVIDGGSSEDSGLGLTDILLIVLVVLIVIMAIIVAMRLMRS